MPESFRFQSKLPKATLLFPFLFLSVWGTLSVIKASEALGQMVNPNTASFHEWTGSRKVAEDALGSANPVLGQDGLCDS